MLLFAAYTPDFLVKFFLFLKRRCLALNRNCVTKSCRLAAACFLSALGLPVDAIKRKEHLITAFIGFVFKHFTLIWIPPTPAALAADSPVCFWKPPSCHRRDKKRRPLRTFTQLNCSNRWLVSTSETFQPVWCLGYRLLNASSLLSDTTFSSISMKLIHSTLPF